MKIKIILSFLFLYIYHLSVGQQIDSTNNYTISGTVVDGETNEILVGAHILNSNYIATKTDESGIFAITVNSNDTLRVSYIGYKYLFFITPNQEKGKYIVKFKLYTDSVMLQEIEIFPWPSYDEFKKAFAELESNNHEIKMEGVKLYKDRNIDPMQFTMLHALTNPISLIYDKLLDKKAKQKRRIERRRLTIKEASFIKN